MNEIRPARAADAAAIARIWNHYVENGTATFNSVHYTSESVLTLLGEIEANAWGAFVASDGAKITGFALYKPFRGGIGYRFSMEHSIYIDQSAQNAGVGKALYLALEAHAKRADVHSFTGVITTKNQASIDFHLAMGFEECGRLREIGYKFGHWHDASFLQKRLKRQSDA